jgi:hypothetical protein
MVSYIIYIPDLFKVHPFASDMKKAEKKRDRQTDMGPLLLFTYILLSKEH